MKAKATFDVLVVDDQQVVIDSVRKILTLDNYTVDEATDVESAAKKVGKGSHKIILTDLMLPKVSGLELIKIAHEVDPDIPVVMITGYATLENAVQSLQKGAFDFVPKPFDSEELLGVVSRALRYRAEPKSAGAETLPSDAEERTYLLGQHSWAKLHANGTATLGLGETFSRVIRGVKHVDFPHADEQIRQGNVCVKISTEEEMMHTVWAPLSGKVLEPNQALEGNFTLLNSEPFSQGWLIRIIPTNPEIELANLTLV